MKLKITSILYQIVTALILIYLFISFFLWLPTPIEMMKGTSIGAPAGAIVGIFLLPFLASFYMALLGLFFYFSLKLYDYLHKENREIPIDSLLQKQITITFIISVLLFFFLSNDKNIILKGRINPLSNYSIGVEYKAQRGGFFCTEWVLWNGTHRKVKYYEYYPTIKENKHYIEIPTHKMFFSFCDYKMEKVDIDVNLDYDKVVLFKRGHYTNPSFKSQIKLIEVKNNIYTIDIEVK